MHIESKQIEGKNLSWVLRCPTKCDANELSQLRIKMDGETENLDREPGENLLTPEGFEKLIHEDSISERTLFLVAEVEGKIVGFTRCEGNKLSRFRHKAEFGICVLKEYWGHGMGKVLIENILLWTDHVGIEKISLTVVETNKKAIELYKRYGFVEEGLLIKDRIHKDGNYYNTVIMGRLSTKFYNPNVVKERM
jgi:RimJ/RimL family protein N-acetyltransferase